LTTFRRLGHASVLLEGAATKVVVDPWRRPDDKLKADVVLVTHGHPDHCSEEDVALVAHERTTIVCPAPLVARLESAFPGRVTGISSGGAFREGDLVVRAFPHAGPERARGFHPPGDGLSYLADVGGKSHLLLGDSTALPDHEGLAPDVAFFAVGGLAVMTPEEAADAAAKIRPRLAVPVHWGDLNGRFDMAALFETLCAARGVRAEARPEKE